MTNKEILQADLLDILFEHRNKSYGAYALRKTYDRRLSIALGAALLTVLISLAISFLKNKKSNYNPGNNENSMIITNVEIPKDKPKPEPERVKPKPPVATRDFQPPVIVPDKDVDTILVRNEDLEDAAIGNKNIEGDKPDNLAKAVTVVEGDGGKTKDEPEVKEPDLPTYPPEFPGGDAAWLTFLRKYLQSPDELEPGQKMEVVVRFWIDVDGSVSRPEVVKSGGSSFDK